MIIIKPIRYDDKIFRSMRELAAHYGIPYGTFTYRIKTGMSIEEALNSGRKRKKGKNIIIDGKEYDSVKQAIENNNNMTSSAVYKRIRRGEDIESALTRESCAGYHKGVTINGVFYRDRKDAARAYNIKSQTVHNRIKRGYSEQEAYTMASEVGKDKKGKPIENIPGGPYSSIKEAAISKGLKPSTVYARIHNGVSILVALADKKILRSRIECYGKRHSSIKAFAVYYNLPLNQVYRRLKWGWEPERIVEELLKKHKNTYSRKFDTKYFEHSISEDVKNIIQLTDKKRRRKNV